MKRKVTQIVLLGSLLCITLSVNAQVEERIKELSTKKFRWFVDKQYDSLENFLGSNLMYIHSNGWIESEKDVIEDLKAAKITYKEVTVHESSVRVYGNTAILVAKGRFHVVLGGNEGTFELLFTEVYIRDNGSWKIVSRHASRL